MSGVLRCMRVASRLAFVVFMSCMCFSILRVLCVRVYVLVCVCVGARRGSFVSRVVLVVLLYVCL